MTHRLIPGGQRLCARDRQPVAVHLEVSASAVKGREVPEDRLQKGRRAVNQDKSSDHSSLVTTPWDPIRTDTSDTPTRLMQEGYSGKMALSGLPREKLILRIGMLTLHKFLSPPLFVERFWFL